MILFYCERPSHGLKNLRECLKEEYGIRSRKIASNYAKRPKRLNSVFNWGMTKGCILPVINAEERVSLAVNKLYCLQRLWDKEVSCPRFTDDAAEAKGWIQGGAIVFARKILNGSGGAGIVECTADNGILPAAPLYVEYIKKKKEFRVHVFNGKVIDVQEKRKERDFDGVRNTRIRNLDNGYIFAREGLVEPDTLRKEALLAVAALGLFFGAVDIVWNAKQNRCYVLEINTAPGIQESTVHAYAAAIKEFLG